MRTLLLAVLLIAPAASARAEAITCEAGTEKDPEKIRALLWRLAATEVNLGYDTMYEAYGKVDICEHALMTDDIAAMAAYDKPLPTDSYPYDQIASNGGVFLPVGVKYNHAVCAGPLGELDMRWFIQGYLGGGLVKEAVGEGYNLMQGYKGSAAGQHNAAVNMQSLRLGKDWHGSKKNLTDFARLVLNGLKVGPQPPKDGKYREWAVHKPTSRADVLKAIVAEVPGARVSITQPGMGRFHISGVAKDRREAARIRSAANKAAAPKLVLDDLTVGP